ncbi:MAG: hypothetical protein QM486_02730 [Flavobacteriaceae bacterium]
MKKIIYFGLGLILLSFLTNCKSGKINNKLPFKIVTKTYYNWTGGQPGVKGTNVVLKLMNTSKSFKADSLYFNGKGTLLEIHIKKDTLVLMGYYSTPRVPVRLEIEPSQKKITKKPITKIPYTLKANEAVLTYFINGVKKYLRLADLAETDKKYYP